MAKSFDFIVLGEENPDLRSHLHYQVIESRTNPFLHLFLDRASSALRHAIAQLSPPERKQIPAFSCIDELNESSDAGQGHSGIQNALNCVYQIGQYIKYALLTILHCLHLLSFTGMPEVSMASGAWHRRHASWDFLLAYYQLQLSHYRHRSQL